jgi:glutathione S-transferase
MLTVHHLGRSQSERIVWLCEELEIPYRLLQYSRDPITRFAPTDYRALHPIGTAPIITNRSVILPESGAIIEYIITRYGSDRLKILPGIGDFPSYLLWFHFASASLLPSLTAINQAAVLKNDNSSGAHRSRVDRAMSLVEARLAQAQYFAGELFSAADIMMFFPLTTLRHIRPMDLTSFRGIRGYLKRVGERPAYLKAMRKSDPDMPLMSALRVKPYQEREACAATEGCRPQSGRSCRFQSKRRIISGALRESRIGARPP